MRMTLRTEQVIGRRIRELRERAGLTIEQLADKAGKSGMTLRNLERGRFVPDLATIDAFAGALNVKTGELVDGPRRKRAS